jgi:hypothetical protein
VDALLERPRDQPPPACLAGIDESARPGSATRAASSSHDGCPDAVAPNHQDNEADVGTDKPQINKILTGTPERPVKP